MSIKDFLNKHISFKPDYIALPAFITGLLIYPAILFLPQSIGYENGLIENMQMIVLALCVFYSAKAKNNKKIFTFAALVIIILMLREINCGRTLFFAIPGQINSFYSWKEIKYGYLAHPLYGTYIALVCLYFFKNKLFLPVKELFLKIKLPFWNVFFCILGIILSLYADKYTKNYIFEEMSELFLYLSMLGIIYKYSSCSENDLGV